MSFFNWITFCITAAVPLVSDKPIRDGWAYHVHENIEINQSYEDNKLSEKSHRGNHVSWIPHSLEEIIWLNQSEGDFLLNINLSKLSNTFFVEAVSLKILLVRLHITAESNMAAATGSTSRWLRLVFGVMDVCHIWTFKCWWKFVWAFPKTF